MSYLKQILPVFVLIVFLLWPGPAAADEPVVRAVLFWSDGCPHCHYVIDEVLPPIQERYGPQFQLKLLQVEYPQNWSLYQQTVQLFNISNDRFGVPTLLIGRTVLVGSQEIPGRLAGEIEHWLAAGGVDYPALPGLANAPAVDMCGAVACDEWADSLAPAELPPAPTPGPDPIANALAGGVLVGMVTVLGYAFVATTRANKRSQPSGRAARLSRNRTRPNVSPLPSWQQGAIPLLALLGLGVASYLAYAKLANSAVACGPVGDCDAVQASIYSEFLGIPVALLGAFSYLGILGLWLASTWLKQGRNGDLAWLGLFGLALIGTLFSLYLTFLEPFVIGAVCAWCLTSAVIMTLILLLTTQRLTQETLAVRVME